MMADKVHIVDRFLDRLAAATKKKSKQEDAALRKFARQKLGVHRLNPWDVLYVTRKMCDAKFGIDAETVRAYFPLESVLAGLSRLTGRLYAGCSIVESSAPTWNESVRFFEIKNAKGKTLGGFYLDPFSRKGKANGAWAFSVMVRYEKNGRIQYPVVAITLNLRPPQGGEQATLTHEDLTTLFHEFGHTLHLIFGKTKHRDSMAFFLEWDAVELPSQMMEQWCWRRDVLIDLSCHKATGKIIPEDILNALIASRHYRAGSEYGYRVTRAVFDWRVHQHPPKNEAELMKAYRDAAASADALRLHPSFRGPHTFTHIFSGGYGAGYYGYIWSDSLVADLFAAFRHAGKENEAFVARKYRKEILSMGSARLFAESFKAFRGRGHRTRFVLRHLGLIK
jgi:oligopeptidase A